MTRMLRLLAVLLALALVAAACGDDDDETAAGGGDTTDTGGQTDACEGESLRVAAKWSGAEQEAFQQVLENFEERSGASVTYTSTGDDIATVLGGDIAGGDPPDVAILPQPGLLRQFAERGNLVAIEDTVGEVIDENYAPVWRELGTIDGTLYGVWFKAANKSPVWYNTDAFSTAGVQPPEDWESFLQVASTLRDAGITPVSIGGADGWTLTDWFENVYLRTAGPELYTQLANHEIPWTHESVIEALNTLGELWGQEDLIVGNPLQTDFNTSVTQVFTDPPAGAIVYEGDFVAGVIAAETDAQVGTDAEFFSFPSIDESEPSTVMGGGDVAVLMQDTECGTEMMRFLASPESAEVWATLGGFASPNQNVDFGSYPDEVSQRLAQALVEAEVFRFDLSDQQPAEFGATTGQGMWQLFQDFLANPDNAEAIAQQLEASAAAAFG